MAAANGLMDTPVQPLPRSYRLPLSEQHPPTNTSSFPQIGARAQMIQDTPVQHMNMKLEGVGQQYPPPPQQEYVSNFRTYEPPARENVLTPSPRSNLDYQHSTIQQ